MRNPSCHFLTARRKLTGLPLLGAAVCAFSICAAQNKPPAANSAPDVLVLSNGDTLHGKFVSEVNGNVTFHCDPLGDVTIAWDKIKELHATEPFAVLDKTVKLRGKKDESKIPVGTLEMTSQNLTVQPASGPAPAPIPVKNAAYVIDQPTLSKQVFHEPSFFAGWNGAATAGATLVSATQNQYTVSGGIGLVRVVPTVGWLNPRDRTSADFSGSFGKITQAGVPPLKSAITHVDAERDQYVSSRFFALGQAAFDHNYSQDLSLQQIYGGGFGWTAIKSPKQEADIKGTVQYEKQAFITDSGANQNLIGSTFSIAYLLHLKLFTYTQGLAYIPAWNTPRAYSANETDTLAFPVYKNFSFSVGTLDSYLNDPPATTPPTKRNSFQFTMGLTYAIKSKY
ncbi:MAG TPA: DUF481 domain-containing protein [Terracidiphilus sp.]|nr:DUF481 domain-containing protein [Terracidiphilus sp.]